MKINRLLAVSASCLCFVAACDGAVARPTGHDASLPFSKEASVSGHSDPSGGAAARNGDIAILEEFEAAERAGTAEAYALFARRHPHHRLAAEARGRAERLMSSR